VVHLNVVLTFDWELGSVLKIVSSKVGTFDVEIAILLLWIVLDSLKH